MSKITKIFLFIISSFFGIILAYIINFGLELIIFPDICYYHSHPTNIFIDLFYDFPSWNGSHPYPSTFNMIITILFGIYIGYFLTNRYLNYKK